MKQFERQIAIADIHGCLNLLKDLVENQIKFNPDEDKLILLGDYLDRGNNSKGVVEYLQNLRQRYPDNIVLLMGNHEHLAKAFLTQGDSATVEERMYAGTCLMNGGGATIRQYGGLAKAREVLLPFIDTLLPFYETENHIFVHGGINGNQDVRKVPLEELLWNRDFKYRGKKTLVVGHSPVKSIRKIGNVIYCDTGCFMSRKLSAYDVLNRKVYQVVDSKRQRRSYHESQLRLL